MVYNYSGLFALYIMNNTIKEILDKQKAAEIIIGNCKDAIKSLQALCEHNWECKGHSHNDTLYACSNCGKEDWQ